MSGLLKYQVNDGEIYLAGQRVPAGRYRQIESTREVCLMEEDILPASLDGRVACYELRAATWGDCQQKVRRGRAIV